MADSEGVIIEELQLVLVARHDDVVGRARAPGEVRIEPERSTHGFDAVSKWRVRSPKGLFALSDEHQWPAVAANTLDGSGEHDECAVRGMVPAVYYLAHDARPGRATAGRCPRTSEGSPSYIAAQSRLPWSSGIQRPSTRPSSPK